MPPPLPNRKFPWLVYLIVLAAILAVAPVGSVLVAGLIAKSHGCQLDGVPNQLKCARCKVALEIPHPHHLFPATNS